MKNFEGVEKYLNEGCFIIGEVIKNGFDRIFFTAVYKKYKKQTKIVSYSGGNILSALNKISLKKIEPNASLYKLVQVGSKESIVIDELLFKTCAEYSIHFYGLSNKQYLSTICVKSSTGEYIPLQSVITETILSGIEILNDALNRIKKEHPQQTFVDLEKSNAPYIEAVEESIKGHQKTIVEKK